MIVFAHVFLIILEIIATFFIVKGVIEFENKIKEFHILMLEKAKQIIEINDEVKNVLSKINRVIKIINNKKLHQIKRIVMMSLDVIQVVMLFRSLKLSKSLKTINYDLLKKIAYARITQQALRKILDFAHNLCAI